MKILLLNNTSLFHSGSYQVMKFFKTFLAHHELDLNQKIKAIDPKNYDCIIVNGEGSLHGDTKRVKSYIPFLHNASNLGVKTFLVNSVWQNNSKYYSDMLTDMDYVGVREIKSKNEILKYSAVKNVDVHLDLSYYLDVENIKFNKTNIMCGNYYTKGKRESTKLITGVGEDGHVDIFNESWNIVVNKLRSCNLLITGRHHEMYAACKARCPFIVINGNTHKNIGLLETFKVDIPILPTDASLNDILIMVDKIFDYNEEFTKLFDRMEKHPLPEFIKYV